MGYDFKMVRVPSRIPEGHVAQGSNPAYHRFNVHAMNAMRVAMQEWCEATDYSERPAFPAFPPAGFRDASRAQVVLWHLEGDKTPLDPPATPEEIAAGRKYLAAHEAVVTRAETTDGKVAGYKFESNDGWLVTPEECRILVERLKPCAGMLVSEFFMDAGYSREDATLLVNAWVAFNELAAENGGYRVR